MGCRDAVWKENSPSCYENRETKASLPGSWPNPRVATRLRRCHLSFVSSSRRMKLEGINTLPHYISFYSTASSVPLLAAQRQVAPSFLLPEIGWLTPQGSQVESGVKEHSIWTERKTTEPGGICGSFEKRQNGD